ncbi:MAG: 8-oxo-dGTP diphosphatase MutT [Gammaproteobacteria bacterium]
MPGLKQPEPVLVAAGVIRDSSGRILIAQRPAGSHAGGFWEFPGGKIQAGEDAFQALVRELAEEIGIQVFAASPLMICRHSYPERVVELHVFEVSDSAGEARGLEGQPLRWVTVEELGGAGLLEADLPIAAALMEKWNRG